MTDLVVVSLERWDSVWRRNQHLVTRLMGLDPSLRVLFVEPATDPLHDLRSGRRPRWGGRIRRVDERLWAISPLKPLPRRLDPRSDRRFSAAVRRSAASLGMSSPMLWVNDPARADVSSATGWPTLYDITDDWAVADRPSAERDRIIAGEELLLREAGEVIACSFELERRKAPARPAARRPISVIPNALDLQAYRAPRARPSDLPAGRTALYLGTMHPDRLDVDLCIRAAEAIRDVGTLVFVGPDLLGAASARLRAAGAAVLGPRPHDRVAAYLQHADVLVVPHVVNSFTESLDPIKLYEYRAVSKPIVATPVAGFRESGGPNTILASAEGFPRALRSAVTRRSTTVTADEDLPDWADRAAEVARILQRAHT
jgi:teichuronic acid biosynthesis glycosyltransferase TuaH